jgi:hypothetical protein
MSTQVMTKQIAKWTVAIVSGAIMWLAGSATLGAVDSASAATVTAAAPCPINTWPCSPAQTADNTWPKPVAGTGEESDDNTWPVAGFDCPTNTWPC